MNEGPSYAERAMRATREQQATTLTLKRISHDTNTQGIAEYQCECECENVLYGWQCDDRIDHSSR